MEDLWCFNDEAVARAIAACDKPVISAVGHEIDFTMSDFVADYRAPTPSAAAEVVSANVVELMEKIDTFEHRLVQAIQYKLSEWNQTVDHLKRRLVDPKKRLQDLKIRCQELQRRLQSIILRIPKENKNRCKDLERRLRISIMASLKERKQILASRGALLDSLSPLRVVDRGYSIVKKGDQVIKNVSQLSLGEMIQVRFAKGLAEAKIEKIEKNNEEATSGL